MSSDSIHYTEGDDECMFPINSLVKPEDISEEEKRIFVKSERPPSELQRQTFEPETWTVGQVAAWIRGLGTGYEQCADAFEANGIDGDRLRSVNEQSIGDLVKSKEQQKMILLHLESAIWKMDSQNTSGASSKVGGEHEGGKRVKEEVAWHELSLAQYKSLLGVFVYYCDNLKKLKYQTKTTQIGSYFQTTICVEDQECVSAKGPSKKTSKKAAAGKTLELICPEIVKEWKEQRKKLSKQSKASKTVEISFEEYSKLRVEDPRLSEWAGKTLPAHKNHKSPMQLLKEYQMKKFVAVPLKAEKILNKNGDDKMQVTFGSYVESARIHVPEQAKGCSTKIFDNIARHRCAQLILQKLFPDKTTWTQLLQLIARNPKRLPGKLNPNRAPKLPRNLESSRLIPKAPLPSISSSSKSSQSKESQSFLVVPNAVEELKSLIRARMDAADVKTLESMSNVSSGVWRIDYDDGAGVSEEEPLSSLSRENAVKGESVKKFKFLRK